MKRWTFLFIICLTNAYALAYGSDYSSSYCTIKNASGNMIAMVDKNGNLIISGPNCIRELPIVVVDYDFDNFYYEQNSYYPRNSYPWMHQNYIVDRGGRPPRPPKSDGKSNISYRPAGEKMSSKPGRAAAVPKRRSSTDNEGHGPRRRGNRR